MFSIFMALPGLKGRTTRDVRDLWALTSHAGISKFHPKIY